MNQEGFKLFESRLNKRIQSVLLVGQIRLIPEAGRKEYTLASMDVLSIFLGRPADFEELRDTLIDVAAYRLWDADQLRISEDVPTVFRHRSSVHRELLETTAHLQMNGLVNERGDVSELGRILLNEVTLPEEVHSATFTRDLD